MKKNKSTKEKIIDALPLRDERQEIDSVQRAEDDEAARIYRESVMHVSPDAPQPVK